MGRCGGRAGIRRGKSGNKEVAWVEREHIIIFHEYLALHERLLLHNICYFTNSYCPTI